MAPKGDDLIKAIWAAVNWETMGSLAWDQCFRSVPDLRSAHYRQIVFIVVLLSSQRGDCTLSTIQRLVARRDLLDPKTVALRVERLIDAKLLERIDHPSDKRKQVIRPTVALLGPLRRYSELTLDIAAEMTRPYSDPSDSEFDADLRFDLRDFLEEPRDRRGPDNDPPSIGSD
ncbi:hypothetical protein AB8B21_28155 [Tardiphaga sp. 866_E4_N2_1]|uniref:hypothetical protein n=1 Tax=unclassified Tardiphaga TaxID=2631404 RepID=UPI003F24F2EB